MHSPQGVVAAGLSDDAAERRPTVSPRVTRPPGERGLAEMYSDRVSQGRTPSSPRDHILFGGNRANHQAGTKFAAGGFPYLFVIVMMLWMAWKGVLLLALHGVSYKWLGAMLMCLCCTPMLLQVLWPSTEYEINLGATLQQYANGTLQDSIIDPRWTAEEDAAVPRDASGTVRVDALLGAVVAPSYSPPELVVEGVAVDAFASGIGSEPMLVGRAALPRVGLVVCQSSDVPVPAQLLTGHTQPPAEERGVDGDPDADSELL